MQPQFSDIPTPPVITSDDGVAASTDPALYTEPDLLNMELMADAGLELRYTTTEVAELFERTNWWLYFVLRNYVNEDGAPIVPGRTGTHRRFTLPVVMDILRAMWRAGNMKADYAHRVLRRIRIDELGGDWRKDEGWHEVLVGKYKRRLMHPEKCEFINGEWVLKEKFRRCG